MLADANADDVLGLSVDAVLQNPARKDKPVPWDYHEDELLKACVLRHRTPRNQPAWPAISAELRSEGYTRTAQEARCRFSSAADCLSARQKAPRGSRLKVSSCNQLRRGRSASGIRTLRSSRARSLIPSNQDMRAAWFPLRAVSFRDGN